MAAAPKDSSVTSTALFPSLLRRIAVPPSPMIALPSQHIFIGSLGCVNTREAINYGGYWEICPIYDVALCPLTN